MPRLAVAMRKSRPPFPFPISKGETESSRQTSCSHCSRIPYTSRFLNLKSFCEEVKIKKRRKSNEKL